MGEMHEMYGDWENGEYNPLDPQKVVMVRRLAQIMDFLEGEHPCVLDYIVNVVNFSNNSRDRSSHHRSVGHI